MAKNTAACGKRDERELVKDLKARGYEARRQPGSGNVDPTLPHDVVWEDSPIGKLLIECKWRATCGWRTLLTWMEGAPILTVKCSQAGANQHKIAGDETDRYVFMKWDTFMALVGDAAARSEYIDVQSIPVEEIPVHDSREAFPLPSKWVTKQELEKSYPQEDLPPVEPDKPWLTEPCAAMEWEAYSQEGRAKIQAAHQNPPQRKPKPRGFGR